MSKIRTFIAVELENKTKDDLFNLSNHLKKQCPANSKSSWVKKSNYHITLKFLGDTNSDLVENIEANIVKTIKSIGLNPFEIVFCRTGYFPNINKPRILWAGIDNCSNQLVEIANQLNTNLQPLGFVPEKRAFKSHMTLARIKYIGKGCWPKEIEFNNQSLNIEKSVINSITLFKSDLKPQGAIYTKLKEVTL